MAPLELETVRTPLGRRYSRRVTLESCWRAQTNHLSNLRNRGNKAGNMPQKRALLKGWCSFRVSGFSIIAAPTLVSASPFTIPKTDWTSADSERALVFGGTLDVIDNEVSHRAFLSGELKA
jgi:hypothetical protein